MTPFTICVCALALSAPPASKALNGKKGVALDPKAWHDASKHYVIVSPNLTIVIEKVTVQPIAINYLGTEKITEEKYLVIAIGTANVSETKKIDYVGWLARDARHRFLHPPTLVDNFDNRYAPINFGLRASINGQIGEFTIHPEKILTDYLVFELPIRKAKHLRLSLPTKGLGINTEPIQLEIPATMIDWGSGKKKAARETVHAPDGFREQAKGLLGSRATIAGQATVTPVGKAMWLINYKVDGVDAVTTLISNTAPGFPRRAVIHKTRTYAVTIQGEVSRIGADGVVYLEDVSILNPFWLK